MICRVPFTQPSTFERNTFPSVGVTKMSDRKYRHRGYMDSDRDSPRSKPQSPESKTQSPARDREGPRSPRMMAFNETVKCAACGAKAPAQIAFDTTCTKCRVELHNCRQCNYFDPGAHFECSKPISKRIV